MNSMFSFHLMGGGREGEIEAGLWKVTKEKKKLSPMRNRQRLLACAQFDIVYHRLCLCHLVLTYIEALGCCADVDVHNIVRHLFRTGWGEGGGVGGWGCVAGGSLSLLTPWGWHYQLLSDHTSHRTDNTVATCLQLCCWATVLFKLIITT